MCFCTSVNACVITLHFIGLNLRCKEQQLAGHLVVVTCVSHLYLVLLIEVSAVSVFGVNTRGFNRSELSQPGKHVLTGSASQGPSQCLVLMTAPVRGVFVRDVVHRNTYLPTQRYETALPTAAQGSISHLRTCLCGKIW